MNICYQKKKQIIYSEVCPEKVLRALAANRETKLLTDCCRLALKYAEEDPVVMSEWFSKRFMKFCKDMTKEMGQRFLNKTNQQKLLLFADYEKGEHPFINFCASGYDESDVKDKKTGKMKKGPWRKQKYVHLSGLVAIDIDHVDDPKAIFERWQKEIDFKALKIYLIYITPRGSGLRVVFRCDVSRGNLIDNQMWMCEKLGVEPDGSCKDASRGYFLTSADNFLYDDLKQMYDDEADEAFIQKYEPEYRAGNSSGSKTGTQANMPARQGTAVVGQVDAKPLGDSLKWHGYDIQAIIDAWSADHFGSGNKEVSRHAASLSLAKDLFVMLDRDGAKTLALLKAQKWVHEIIDERNEDVERTVSDAANYVAAAESEAAKKGKNWLPQPSKEMQAAVQTFCGKSYQEIVGASAGSATAFGVTEDDISRWLWDWGEQIEKLAEDFPLIRDICKDLKRNQYPAALFVAGGLLMTLMTRCTYRFYHRRDELRRLNNCTLIIGDPASGKSFATRLYKLLSAPIVAADKIGKDAINAYREQMRTKGANKEKPKKPKVIVRIHPARTSNAQFIQDMVNSVEEVDGQPMQLHMLTFDTELDNTVTVQKGGSWIDKQSLELKAFHNEEDGQAYSNNDSILQDFYVTWNFIYTGTPIALKKKVNEQNFGSGLATRLTCIPLPASNYEMMVEDDEVVDLESNHHLTEWAERLDRMKGELSVKKIVHELYEWTARRMADAKDNDSKADEMLLKRCAYHGLNFSAPFIVMRHWDQIHQDGQYWCGEFETDEVDWRLAELIVNIQYACQRHYFGAMAEAYFDNKKKDASVNVRRQQKTYDAFNRLPQEFTVEDVMRCFNLSTEGAVYSKTRRLLEDHLIEKISDSRKSNSTKTVFRKTGSIML